MAKRVPAVAGDPGYAPIEGHGRSTPFPRLGTPPYGKPTLFEPRSLSVPSGNSGDAWWGESAKLSRSYWMDWIGAVCRSPHGAPLAARPGYKVPVHPKPGCMGNIGPIGTVTSRPKPYLANAPMFTRRRAKMGVFVLYSRTIDERG